MKHYTIRHGERPSADPAPIGDIEEVTAVQSVAVLGEDWPGLRPRLLVDVGTRVTRGQTLFTDRNHRDVCFASPVTGVIESVTFGPRRVLDAMILEVDPNADDVVSLDRKDPSRPRDALLSSGLWPAFRTRPFGFIPAPDAVPEAIVVNAVRAAPQAPDPHAILKDRIEAFRSGCEILTRVTDGSVFVCQSPGSQLGPTHDRVCHASFSGTVAAGLPGTQIDRLCRGQKVWSIGCQDVAAIGHFFATGEYAGHRIISATGPMALPPRLLRVPLGTRLADVVGRGAVRALAGGATAGREAVFLGRFHDQIVLLSAEHRHRFQSISKVQRAAIPSRALDTAIALDVLTVPLLRALSVRDAEAAEKLGCLALIEEDLAAATRRCTSGVDYGKCLRGVLSDLSVEAA